MWGAGETGRAFARALAAEGIRVALFVEVDRKKIGRTVRGAPVVVVRGGPPRARAPAPRRGRRSRCARPHPGGARAGRVPGAGRLPVRRLTGRRASGERPHRAMVPTCRATSTSPPSAASSRAGPPPRCRSSASASARRRCTGSRSSRAGRRASRSCGPPPTPRRGSRAAPTGAPRPTPASGESPAAACSAGPRRSGRTTTARRAYARSPCPIRRRGGRPSTPRSTRRSSAR